MYVRSRRPLKHPYFQIKIRAAGLTTVMVYAQTRSTPCVRSVLFLTAQGLHQQPGTGNVQVLPNHYNYCESTGHLAVYTHTFLSSVRVNQYGTNKSQRKEPI